MKPGKNDIPIKVKISGRQLEELQKHTWQMCEAFGLDRKIEKGSLYKLDKYLNLIKVDQNYRITNGPAFLDEYNFYHTDSSKKIIYKIKFMEEK